MNSYNLFNSENPSTVIYHAIAEDEEQIKELANEAGFNIESLDIEIERENVKDEMGRPLKPSIKDAIIY